MPRNAPRHQPAFAAEQAAFAASLLWRDDGLPPGITSHSSPRPVRRFNVYRNNVFHSLTDAVAARFPVVERLVGEDFFRAAARVFIERHPPRSPALLEYGGDFPAFLDAFEPVAHLPYLGDVARLEWARNAAYHAADAEPLAPAALAALPPDALGDAVLHLHPAAHLVTSPYPVVSIWQTNTYDAVVRPIGPELPGEAALVRPTGSPAPLAARAYQDFPRIRRTSKLLSLVQLFRSKFVKSTRGKPSTNLLRAVLVVRPRLTVLVLPLPPGADIFAASIAHGLTLGAAAARASGSAGDFALAQTLAAFLTAGAFTGVSVKVAN